MSITKFGWGHFPVGTTCVIHLDHGQQVKPPFTVTVTGVSRNGPNSYCIDTDTPGTVTEFFTCNIDHVAEITKRGPGIATLIDAHSQSSEKFWTNYSQEHLVKHKNHYGTYVPRGLCYAIASEYLTDDQQLSMDRLIAALYERGIMQAAFSAPQDEWHRTSCIFKKKQLRKAIRQLVNKCLLNHKHEQRRQDTEDAIAADRDWENSECDRFAEIYDQSEGA